MGHLGIAMLTRNDEDLLSHCLRSVRGVWDQLVVVDTGSTDHTIEIAQSFGAEVVSVPWGDDFAAARNVGWDRLQTEWKMWVDSVPGDTPVLVRKCGSRFVEYMEVRDLLPSSVRGKRSLVYARSPYEVLTHEGWQRIRWIKQHRVQKSILRIVDDGDVCVTEDHSLFAGGRPVAGRDVAPGTVLDHVDAVHTYGASEVTLTVDLSEAWGFFVAEGSAQVAEPKRKVSNTNRYTWQLPNTNRSLLEKYKVVFEAAHTRSFYFVEDVSKVKHGYLPTWKLWATDPKDVAVLYREKFYTSSGRKKVPVEVLNGTAEIKNAFLRGWELGDGYVRRVSMSGKQLQSSSTDSRTLAAGLLYLYRAAGRDFYCGSPRRDKLHIIRICERAGDSPKSWKKTVGVRHIRKDSGYAGFVYDLNTYAGTFVGGVGDFVLHNSDDVVVGLEHLDELLSKLEQGGLDGAVLEYLYAFDAVGLEQVKVWLPLLEDRRLPIDHVVRMLHPRCNTTQWRERIVRNDPTWRWVYPVHEALPAAGRRLGKYDRIKVIHLRQLRSRPIAPDRNLRILLSIPESQRDERFWFYLGLERAGRGDIDEAIQAFERYAPMSTVEDEKYQAWHFLGDLYRTKGDLERSVDCNLRALGLRPTWRDAYAGLLEACVVKQDWPRAVYYGAQIERTEVPDTPFAYNPLHESVGWVGDYVRALVEVGQIDEAVRVAQRALDATPEDPAVQHNVDVLSVWRNVASGRNSLAEAVEFLLRHDDTETAAVLLGRLSSELTQQPPLKAWAQMVDTFCGRVAAGWIVRDQLRVTPARVHFLGKPLFDDARMCRLRDELARRPEVRSVLQVGGPVETSPMYSALGIQCSRVEHVEDVGSVPVSDLVMLWGCLERVKVPESLVALAESRVVRGGVVCACVPNGPATKGLAPPAEERLRLRAYSVDAFRQVMGTLQMPELLPGGPADSGDLWLTVSTALPTGRPKRVAIVCPLAPEIWGPWSLDKGIGGSEEAVVRLSRAFVRRGHAVVVYGSGWSGVDVVSGVEYESMRHYGVSDVVIGWRYPEMFINQVRPLEAEWKALWLHDSVDRFRVELVAPFVDCIWAISDYHAGLYAGIPRIFKGRNGLDRWEFDGYGGEVVRHPAKAVYLSTPFRGLDMLLEQWPAIRRRVPNAELHAYYGWESADRLGATATPEGAAFKQHVVDLCKQPGVIWRGRVGQPELYYEVLSAGAWLYPSRHKEENCISSYIAQAGGAWPVVFPLGALEQSVVFGWKVGADKFVDAAVAALRDPPGRERMMEWTRRAASWDECAERWERLWSGRAV